MLDDFHGMAIDNISEGNEMRRENIFHAK